MRNQYGLLAVLALMAVSAVLAMPADGRSVSSGCETITASQPGKSVWFHVLEFRFNLEVHTCYKDGVFLSFSETCSLTDKDAVTIDASDCRIQDSVYGTVANPTLGHISQANITVRNCLFHWGCWASASLILKIYVVADSGAYLVYPPGTEVGG